MVIQVIRTVSFGSSIPYGIGILIGFRFSFLLIFKLFEAVRSLRSKILVSRFSSSIDLLANLMEWQIRRIFPFAIFCSLYEMRFWNVEKMSEKEKRERRLDILLMDFSMKLSKIFFFYLLYKIDFINMHSGKIFTMWTKSQTVVN